MAAGALVLASIMAALFLIYTLSAGAKYYIKFSLLTLTAIFAASLPIPIMMLRPFNPKNALIPSWFLLKVSQMLGITWEVRGKENMDERGGIILLNHQSGLDLIILAILWPIAKTGTVVSKESLFWIFPFGPAAWLWGTLFIRRDKPGEARTSINKQAEAIITRKTKLFMFPEGTRNYTEDLLPFKKGAFHLCLQSDNAPIQPVVVSRYHFIDHKKKRFNNGHIIIQILPVIDTKPYNKDNIDELVSSTRKIMQTAYMELSGDALIANSKNRLEKIDKVDLSSYFQ